MSGNWRAGFELLGYSTFDDKAITRLVEQERRLLESSLKNNRWKDIFPGKLILSRFAGNFWSLGLNHVRQAYVDIALESETSVLDDIIRIFQHFNSLGDIES